MSQQMDWTAYGGSAAEIYERHMVPTIFGSWAEDLLALATPQPGERVLDVTGARTLPPLHGAQIEWREGNVSAM